MRKRKHFIGALLTVALLVGAIPAYAADTGGLNGDSGKWSEFNQSVYDVTVSSSSFKSKNFTWPSGGSMLVRASGTNWSASDFSGITVPAGIVLDIYQYAGGSIDSYKLLVHVDTTNGQSYTIGSSSSSSSSSSNTGTSSSSGTSSNSTSSKNWGTVVKTFVPGTPSASYSKSYTDVTPDAWYYHPVMTLTEGGLLEGYGNGKFGPNDSLTKEQVSIIYGRLMGNPAGSAPNSTVASRAYAAIWYAGKLNALGGSHLLTAYESSIIRDSGVSGGLVYSLAQNSQAAIGSMWQAVYDNWRASLAAGRSTDYISSVDELPDADDIHRWIEENWSEMAGVLLITSPGGYSSVYERTVAECEQAICRAYNLGMVTGVDSRGSFAPYSPITRGEMAQILYNVGWTTAGCLNYYSY